MKRITPLIPHADCLFVTRGILRLPLTRERYLHLPEGIGRAEHTGRTFPRGYHHIHGRGPELNASGVGMSIFVGAKDEERTIANLGRLINEAEYFVQRIQEAALPGVSKKELKKRIEVRAKFASKNGACQKKNCPLHYLSSAQDILVLRQFNLTI
jgi:putative autoinducer-2 (AI-2) aldolase